MILSRGEIMNLYNSSNIWLRPITIIIPTEVKFPVKVTLKLEFQTNDRSISIVPQVEANSRKSSNNFLFINAFLEENELIVFSNQLNQGSHRNFFNRSVDLLYSTLSDLLEYIDNLMAEDMLE